MEDHSSAMGLIGGLVGMIIGLGIGLVFYIYLSYSLMVMARKIGTEGTWMAWIPIANLMLMCNMAQKPFWWVAVILLVPIANIIFGFLLWMTIAERLGKPSWIIFLMLIPGVGIFIPAYLAFF